jgi:hypothetical protein
VIEHLIPSLKPVKKVSIIKVEVDARNKVSCRELTLWEHQFAHQTKVVPIFQSEDKMLCYVFNGDDGTIKVSSFVVNINSFEQASNKA